MKSLVFLAIWLALSGAIYMYSRITSFSALNRIFFSANENGTVKQNNQSDSKVCWKSLCGEFCNCYCQNFVVFLLKLCDFKIDLRKWQLNFVSCNLGLKSYLWFQIKLVLRARAILKSRVWFQTKLHSTQFSYHYLTIALLAQVFGELIVNEA